MQKRQRRGRQVLPVTEARQPSSCIHHWLLGEPAGGEVHGSCTRCGAARVFPASPESTDRFDDYRELASGSGYYGLGQPA